VKPEFATLRDLLRRRLEVIADHAFRDRDPAGHLETLREVSEALTVEHARLRSVLPARLNHFLTQSSLSKALEYLESEA
jgi:hypothetical protein